MKSSAWFAAAESLLSDKLHRSLPSRSSGAGEIRRTIVNFEVEGYGISRRRAFEAVEFARSRGKFDTIHWLLFRAFFEEGKDLNDLGVLCETGERCGLNKQELRTSLELGQYTLHVIADEQLAARLGVTAVPCLLAHRP